jgi:DHA2 family multidrug resistance protein
VAAIPKTPALPAAPIAARPPAPPPPVRGYAPPPLEGSARILGTIALSVATFMNVLDTSIANVSIPAISGDVGVSTSQGTWVITSFAVANAISVPLTGWLTQRIGAVRLFTASILLFVLASLACGLAPNLGLLILFRVIQGAVAGPIIPLSQTLLLASYPKERSGTALGLWAMTTLVAPVVGPVLGGYITDNISWPWIFYINVPVGLLTAWASWTIYRTRETPIKISPVDGVGLGLLIIWVGALQVMLDKGKELDWFHSSMIVTLGLVATVGFVLFLIWELVDNKHPIVDLSLFKRRNFSSGVVGLSIGYGAFFGNVVIVPLWLQTQMGYTATEAGLMMAPVGVLAILITPVLGRNLPRLDPRVVASVAFAIFAFVSFMRAGFNTQVDPAHVIIPTIIQGAAMGSFFLPLTALALAGLPPERIAAASGLSNFVRITAGAIGASVVTTLWESRSSMHHAYLTESITAYSVPTTETMNVLMAGGMDKMQATGSLERMVDFQAHMLGADDVFWLTGMIFVFLMFVIWVAKPDRSGKAVDAGGAH